ncbi:hypothetical protein G9A89_021703 [Geosiphon pyriformis]|nr:hypothetical protein G9A89_021703 [Geosiphon pyriformis]
MDYARLCGLFNEDDLAIINYCRLYLHVTTVSELFDPSGRHMLQGSGAQRLDVKARTSSSEPGSASATNSAGEGKLIMIVLFQPDSIVGTNPTQNPQPRSFQIT